jgi:hypothetical protein
LSAPEFVPPLGLRNPFSPISGFKPRPLQAMQFHHRALVITHKLSSLITTLFLLLLQSHYDYATELSLNWLVNGPTLDGLRRGPESRERIAGSLERRPSATTIPSGKPKASPNVASIRVTGSPPQRSCETKGSPKTPPTSISRSRPVLRPTAAPIPCAAGSAGSTPGRAHDAGQLRAEVERIARLASANGSCRHCWGFRLGQRRSFRSEPKSMGRISEAKSAVHRR